MTLFQRSRNKVMVFPWDTPTGEIRGQINVVVTGVVLNRYTGELYPLMLPNKDGSNPDEENNVVDFSLVSFKSKDPRFKRQRVLTPCSPMSTILMSLTGKFVSTGTETATGALEGMTAVVRIMKNRLLQGNPEFIMANVQYVNAPSSNEFPYKLDLDKIQDISDQRYVFAYEKLVFPGLCARRMDKKSGVALLFESGKYVCVGRPTTSLAAATTIADIVEFIESHPEVHIPLTKEDVLERALKHVKRETKKRAYREISTR